MNAYNGFCRPKKRYDHRAFRHSWNKNVQIAIFLSLVYSQSFIIKKRLIHISKYNIVHTGPNTHEGGFNKVLFNDTYQLFTDFAVKNHQTPAAKKGKIIDTINLIAFFIIDKS